MRSDVMKRPKAKTASHEAPLKTKNTAYLWSFIGVNLAVFLSMVVTKGFSGSSVENWLT